MKTFKEYLKEKKQILSWDSANAENRPSILSWDSGHTEVRDCVTDITEEVTYRTSEDAWSYSGDSPNDITKRNKKGATYTASIHDHPEVKAKRLKNVAAIDAYTSASSNSVTGHGSSKNINGYLRNRLGDKSMHVETHSPEAVHKSVQALSSNFTKENTNRKAITTYSGVPSHIGKKLESSKAGDVHHLAGFTSTSTDRSVASDFANNHAESIGIKHVVKFHVHPGAGLSVAAHSPYNENEVLLHHGAKTVYSHTVVNKGKVHHGEYSFREEIHIHHVDVHPEHLPLSAYGSYDHPK